MSKICCLGDTNVCPKASSCSMILRSACSHKHPREISVVKEHLRTSPSSRKSKHKTSVSKNGSCNGDLNLEKELIESSLNKLSVKSAENSILVGPFSNNLKFSESSNQNITKANFVNVSCVKELHFSQLSSSISSLIYEDNNHCIGDYSSATESDINSRESLKNITDMSRSQKLRRSSVSHTRTLSGSEDENESDISIHRIVRPKVISNKNSAYISARTTVLSEEANNQNLLNDHLWYRGERLQNNRNGGSSDSDSLSHFSESSHPGRLVQSSLFHRCRWFLWRCIYLKIIRTVNFDVWLLSRLHSYGKYKVVFFFLLPLLLYLFWHVIPHNVLSTDSLLQVSNSIISSVLYILSIFSSVFSHFVQKCPQFTFGWLITPEESKSTISERSYEPKEPININQKEQINSQSSQLNQEEIKLLYDELNSLKDHMKTNVQEIESIKLEKHSKLQNEIRNLQLQFQSFSGAMKKLEDDIKKQNEKFLHVEAENLNQKKEFNSQTSQSNQEFKVLYDEIESLKSLLKTNIQEIEASKLEKDSKLQTEIKNLQREFQSLFGIVQILEENIKKQYEMSQTKENIIAITNVYKKQIDQLKVKLNAIEDKLNVFQSSKCCDKQWSEEDLSAFFEKYLIIALKNIIDGGSDPQSKFSFFNTWLNSKFSTHEKKIMQLVDAALKKEASNTNHEIDYDTVIKVVEETVLKYVESIKRNVSESKTSSYSSLDMSLFSEDRIKQIVKRAIMLYDADKIGQVDYALESGGGSVLGTRCSESYVEKYGKLSIFGVPLWTNSNSPRTAIQPDVQPGRCWAFRGSQGFLVIELSATIFPTGFTVEHIPVFLSPSGSIDSAPKNFSVWGLDSEKDSNGYLLGEYFYDISGEPLQYFDVQKPSEKPYTYVELQIHSNHGNMEYTCLYRFRVHGKRVR